MILPVVLYEGETWSLIVSFEAKFRVFDNKVFRTIYGDIQNEDDRQHRDRDNNDKLYDLNSRPDIVLTLKS